MTMEAVAVETLIPSLLPETEATMLGDLPTLAPTDDPVAPSAPAAPEEALDEEAMVAMFKAKKKKKKAAEEVPKPVLPTDNVDDEPDETYEQLLARAYAMMNQTKAATEAITLKLRRPHIERIGTKRTGWGNFMRTAEALKRDPNHLALYVATEFGTEVSQSASGVLIIKGRFTPDKIESLLRNYVETYVNCRTCHGTDTQLVREQLTRISYLKCNRCQSQWSVEQIKKGFKATMKGERKQERAREA